MIKVLHLIKALGRGGAEVLLREGLAVADRERFHFSYGYLQTRPDEIVGDLKALGAPVHCFHLNGNVEMILRARWVARYLREQKIDIIHAHLPMAGVVARIAGRLAGVPVVYTEHCPIHRYHPIVRRLSLLTWRLQDRVVAISDDVASSISSHAGDGVPVRSVWNGVNTQRFDPRVAHGEMVRKELGLADQSPLVGTAAVFRDTPQKRLDLWLEAARQVHGADPNVRFLLVGDGPLRESLEGQAKDLGLAQVIHFVGRQEDVRPYLAAMDIFLMSSAYEGCPVAPLEAMAMEVALVATDVEGIRNVVDDGRTGLLASFDRDVAAALAQRVLFLTRNPVRRREIASAGRRAVKERFSMRRMQRQLEGVYDEVLARRRGGEVLFPSVGEPD